MENAPSTAEDRAREFLSQAHLYELGALPTEASHPQTRNLSSLVQSDLPQAARLLKAVDLQALSKFQTYLPQLAPLAAAIDETLAAGRRVFLCGCGATGRLSLTLEFLWRTTRPDAKDRVVAFMAGGDVALVHSLEGFEDYPEYGAEQLRDLGFTEGDLLIAMTEGGETPFVIGATEEATRLSSRPAFFLYCNPRELLIDRVERSKKILTNPRVHGICLFVGPMALAGSTRMQASTVLQLGVGLALLDWSPLNELSVRVGAWVDHYRAFDPSRLVPVIEAEASTYQSGNHVLYLVEQLAITVFTDTTERSPTFSLPPFNNQVAPRPDHSFAYLMIPSAENGEAAWRRLLDRAPRVLSWPDRNAKTTLNYLSGFDFSRHAEAYRRRVLPQGEHLAFTVSLREDQIVWQFLGHEVAIPRFRRHLLYDHLLLKMLLNIHSTLVMGRLGRYESNFMTFVMPTNGKLVNRAARYIKWLFDNAGQPPPSHDEIVVELFRQLDRLTEKESVVLKTYAALLKRRGG